jgi:ATP-binding cassette, subfamily B, bacterial PglK
MLTTYRKLYALLSATEKRRFMMLLGMIVVMGLAEMVSVASVLPFFAVLANPAVVETNPWLAAVYGGLGFTDPQAFLIFLGIGVFCVVVFGLLFATLTQYAIYRFSAMRGHTIASRTFAGYLAQPYVWFLGHNSGDLAATVLGEVNQVVNQVLVPAMLLISQAVVALFIVALLLAVRPEAAIATAIVVGGIYSLIYMGVRRYLARIGEDKVAANRERHRRVNEAVGGIKDVKLLGLEPVYMRRFNAASIRVARTTARNQVIGELPRNILKAIALGGMLFFVLFLLATNEGGLAGILPILGLYAFAALRLFPAVQTIFRSLTQLRFAQAALEKVHADVTDSEGELVEAAALRRRRATTAPLSFRESLAFEDVHYAYPATERSALAGLDLVIPARTTVGIVGGTGAGKTTAVDLILGLLTPQQGAIRIDGVALTPETLRAWQDRVGYVPQQIFLADDSVRGNIAFGRDPDEIDDQAVERAARIAELHAFVTEELPEGYHTLVGERGVRLSGGQRQRIGIARALYHDPDVLVLDEATSALDNLTERAVMDAVHNIGGEKTVVMIAHRLSTVRDCDIIFMLERGRLVAQGRYDDLLDTSQKFRALAAGAV